MAQLIKIITSKPEWKEKITDEKIVKKWKAEIKSQGGSVEYIDIVIRLLNKFNKLGIAVDKQFGNKYYEDYEEYGWTMDIRVELDDVFKGAYRCRCKCVICCGNNLEDMSIKCKCTQKKLDQQKQQYITDHIDVHEKIFNDTTKNNFMKQLKKLKKSIPVDYHPGTNNMTVDIVHPSLYCYVNGVSTISGKHKPSSSNLFQWLPAEFRIGSDGATTIKSYINNLDRKEHPEMYQLIAKIFSKFVPKFENVLSVLRKEGRLDSDDSSDDDLPKKSTKKLSKCQVIVKIAETVLTPDKPFANDGGWHLEGTADENIVATGIYYYQMDNINENHLQFRVAVENNISFREGTKYIRKHYGDDFSNDSDKNRSYLLNLGQIKTKEDMCLVFPNFIQHRVSQLSLVDENRTGKRGILVFFLVNPDVRILSSADVEPQQGMMTETDAKVYRELLMFERKHSIKDQNDFFEREWSLCEH